MASCYFARFSKALLPRRMSSSFMGPHFPDEDFIAQPKSKVKPPGAAYNGLSCSSFSFAADGTPSRSQPRSA